LLDKFKERLFLQLTTNGRMV